MTNPHSIFQSIVKKVKGTSSTHDIKHKLSAHLSEAILAVLNKKQVLNADNSKEIGETVQKATDKLAKDIVKGKITSQVQIQEVLQKTADDISANSGDNIAEGENSRGIGLVAVTTAVTTLNNSPLAQSMAKAVMKKLSNLTLETLDNLPIVAQTIEKIQASPVLIGVIHKASAVDLPGVLGDAAEGAIDGIEDYLAGHTATTAA